MQDTWVRFLGQEDSLEEEMATHSSIHAWKIPRTEESGGLQAMGSQRVGHDLVTNNKKNNPSLPSPISAANSGSMPKESSTRTSDYTIL